MFKVVYNLPGNGHNETVYIVATYAWQHMDVDNDLCWSVKDVYRKTTTIKSYDVLSIELFTA